MSQYGHFFRFCMVGILTTLVYIFIGEFLIENIYLGVLFATNLAFVVAVVVNYILHYLFTFQRQSKHAHSLPRFLITVSLGAGVNTFIIWLVVSEMNVQFIWAQLMAIVVITFSNYMFFKFWVFTVEGKDDVIIS